MTKPGAISVGEKRQLVNMMVDLNMKLSAATPKAEESQRDLTDLAAEEAAKREQILSSIPPEWREQMAKVYDTERSRELTTRRAAHMADMNKRVGHAKSG